MIALVPTGSVRPSTYNPRTADPARLDMIELSLRKLGFLLPIYADKTGEIISGHQRHVVAERMGLKKVPVEYVRQMKLAERKAVNIAFNRGTNDLFAWETPKKLTQAFQPARVREVAEKIPDKPLNDPAFYPCLPAPVGRAERRKLGPLVRANRGRWKQYSRNISRTLHGKGVLMPIICGPGLKVINGIGRLQMLAEMKRPTATVITVSASEAEFTDAVLNLLSMDFDIHNRYADLLRHNSFRRARRVRDYLGRGFVFAVIGSKPANSFDISKPNHRKKWTAIHGRTILDFGAGHLHETDLLRGAGIDVTPFEPYRLGAGDRIDKPESIHLTREFLREVSAGKRWSSVFMASVLNSVPFAADREHLVTICAALATDGARLYAVASSTRQNGWQSVTGGDFANKSNRTNVTFVLPYEEGVQLGEISDRPKVQKYHTVEGFQKLFSVRFATVKVASAGHNIQAVCYRPRPVKVAGLRAALEFEFDLPYPDGSRMGLADDAIKAFSKRLEVKL